MGWGGGPGGFLLPFRLLGSGASWGEITSSPACPPPHRLPLLMAPFSLPGAYGWGGWREKGETWLWKFLQPPWPGGVLGASPRPRARARARGCGGGAQRSLGPLPGVGSGLPCRAPAGTWSAVVFKSHYLLCSLSRCQPPAPPGTPPPLCHGRLGFLGMGFAACHKSHCQGFPTDPEPCLWGCRYRLRCRGRCAGTGTGTGGREAPAACAWPGEQGLAACEQSPQQVVFTVAKFRPPGPRLLWPCRPPVPLSGPPWALPPVPTELKHSWFVQTGSVQQEQESSPLGACAACLPWVGCCL